MSTKPELSAKARKLIDELINSATSKSLHEEYGTRADVNDAVNQFDADKAALEQYVFRLERTVHRTRNELKTVSAKQRGMATETCLTFVVIGVLLLFGAITAVVEKSMKLRQDQLKPSVDCVRPAPSKVYL